MRLVLWLENSKCNKKYGKRRGLSLRNCIPMINCTDIGNLLDFSSMFTFLVFSTMQTAVWYLIYLLMWWKHKLCPVGKSNPLTFYLCHHEIGICAMLGNHDDKWGRPTLTPLGWIGLDLNFFRTCRRENKMATLIFHCTERITQDKIVTQFMNCFTHPKRSGKKYTLI